MGGRGVTYERLTEKEIAITPFLGRDMGLYTYNYMGICEYDSWNSAVMAGSSNESFNSDTRQLRDYHEYKETKRGVK